MARILIIEDERAILNLLQRIAGHMGHEAVAARNGPEALAVADTVVPDLVISDLRMPGTPSGIDLLRALRGRWPRVPLLVISGYASRDLVAKWPELGIDEFLPKPFDMDSIRENIARLLQRAEVPDADLV